jgi:hypothetical protein
MEREALGLAGAERNSAMSKIRRYRNDVAALRREVLKAVRLALLRTSQSTFLVPISRRWLL